MPNLHDAQIVLRAFFLWAITFYCVQHGCGSFADYRAGFRLARTDLWFSGVTISAQPEISVLSTCEVVVVTGSKTPPPLAVKTKLLQ